MAERAGEVGRADEQLWLAGEGVYRMEEERIALPGAVLSAGAHSRRTSAFQSPGFGPAPSPKQPPQATRVKMRGMYRWVRSD